MIRRKCLLSFGTSALAISLLSATSVCAVGQTVATPYLAASSELSSKPAGPATFLAAPAFRVSGTPSSAIATDLNGDGKPDLVVASALSGEITVYLGTGQGNFSNPAVYSVGGHPVAIASADLRGSGRQDIVAANGADGTVSVLLGLGDGKLGPAHVYSAGISADILALGSLRGDGKQDVAIATTGGKKIAVMLNDGHGALAGAISQLLARTPTSLTIAHFRGSDQTDLALADDDGTVSILLGRGDGNFSPPVLLNVSASRLSLIVAGDFDHDGKVDLAVAQPEGHLLTLLRGNGDGTFVPGPSYSVGNDPVYASSLDVNGDGISDLITVNHGSNTFSVLLGNGDGSFKTAVHSTVGDGPVALASGDFYGRGFTGLAVVNAAAKTVSIVGGNGDGSFRAAPSYSGDLSPRSIVAGDLNGDGKPDLVVTNFCGTDVACSKGGTISVYLAKSTGGYSLASKYPVGAGPVSALLSDLNGDKVLDAVVLNRTAKTVSVLLGAGDGTFAEPRTLSLADAPATFAIGDFNKDGKADLAIATDCGSEKCSQPGSLQILFGAGNGSFSAGHTYTLGYSPSSIAVGDLRQTGSLDILIANRCGSDSTCASTGTATVLSGDGKGNFTPKTDLSIGNSPSSIALGSLTGGKVLDLVVSSDSDNAVSVLKGNGDGTFAAPATYPVGNTPRSLVIADFAGSGKKDVAVANFKDSTASILFGNGDGTLQSAVAYSVGVGPESVVAIESKSGGASLVTANGNNGASHLGTGITELANVAPDVTPAPPAPSVAITNSVTPISYGATLSLTATVTPTGTSTAPPTGTLSFTDTSNSGAAVCAPVTLSQVGSSDVASASCTVTPPLAGGTSPHLITAAYAPNTASAGNYSASTSPTFSQLVNAVAPTVTVAANPAAPTFGQAVALTATVGISASGATLPTGTISFTDGAGGPALVCTGVTNGTVPVSQGQAVCQVSTLSVAPHQIAVFYMAASSETNYSNTTVPTIFPLTINRAPTTLSLSQTSPSGSPVVNQTATFTAVLALGTTTPAGTKVPPNSSVSPSEAVVFTLTTTTASGINVSSSAGTLVSGTPSTYTFTTPPLALGSINVAAAYPGDVDFATSNGTPVGVVIGPATPTVTVSGPSAPITINGSATFTATIDSSGSTKPSGGTVSFASGTTPLSCAGGSPTLGTGSVSCTVTSFPLSVGTYPVTATYAGDKSFGSGSGTLASAVTVSAGSTAVTLLPALGTSVVNQAVTLTATVSQTPTPGAILPSGRIAFSALLKGVNIPIPECSGANAVSVTQSTGVATCITGSLGLGSNSITATYNDTLSTPNFTTSTSAASAQTVNQGASTITIGPSATSVVNNSVTFTATVAQSPISPGSLIGSVVPSGQVSFAFTLAGVTTSVAGCDAKYTLSPVGNTKQASASCTTPTLTAGSYSVVASYPGDLNFAAANPSTPATQTVAADPITVTVAPSAQTIVATETAVFKATLTPKYPGPVLPHGTVTFTVTGGDGSIPACVSTPSPGLVQPTAQASSYTAQCSIQYLTGSNNQFTVTANYAEDQTVNFVQAAPGTTSITVGDFSIVPPSTVAATPGVVDVTPGYTVGSPATGVPPTDPFFTSALTTSATSLGQYADSITYTGCTVAPNAGQSSVPTCTIGPATGSGLGSINVSFSAASSTVVPGTYLVTLTGNDQSVSALVRSSTFTVVVVPQTAGAPIIFTASETVNAQFNVPSPSDNFEFACPKNVYNVSSATPTVAIPVTSTPGTPGFYCVATSNPGTLNSKTSPFLIGNPNSISGGQAQLKPSNSGFGIAIAATFGIPLFAIAGWLRRRKGTGERFARLLTLALVLAGLAQVLGCGSNGFTGTAPATKPSSLAVGTYLIQVSATDAVTGQTYYSVINLQLTGQ